MSTQADVTFVIADDHEVVRDAVKSILVGHGFRVLAQASNSGEAVQLCHDLKPDMILLDLSMPGRGGMDAAREIAKSATKVIILSMHTDVLLVEESLRVGAVGYVVKSSSTSCLPRAIEEVRHGRIYVSPKCSPFARGHAHT
jgi:two-component system, NarL family, invasion response regulator UvrY